MASHLKCKVFAKVISALTSVMHFYDNEAKSRLGVMSQTSLVTVA